MPELPEVEVLVRHLAPALKNKTIHGVIIRRPKVLAPTTETELTEALQNATFTGLSRRGKYLLFTLRQPGRREPLIARGTPRHDRPLLPAPQKRATAQARRRGAGFGPRTICLRRHPLLRSPHPRPTRPRQTWPRAVGRGIHRRTYFATALKNSSQAIKIKLLDQTLVAGVGNIYASEALFRAGISPRLSAAKRLSFGNKSNACVNPSGKSWMRRRSSAAARCHSISPAPPIATDFSTTAARPGSPGLPPNAFWCMTAQGQPCSQVASGRHSSCLVQAARSTFYCPRCQRA